MSGKLRRVASMVPATLRLRALRGGLAGDLYGGHGFGVRLAVLFLLTLRRLRVSGRFRLIGSDGGLGGGNRVSGWGVAGPGHAVGDGLLDRRQLVADAGQEGQVAARLRARGQGL